MHVVFECGTALPVKKYGGTERIQYWLMKALVRFGHKVSFIGPKESEVTSIGVNLIPIGSGQSWNDFIPNQADIIHLFSTPNMEVKIPFMVTIEGNGQVGEKFHPNTAFISKKHGENHGSDVFVYNGVDLDEYPFDESNTSESWDRFAFLAKGSWKVKNLEACIRVCKDSKKHLEICGGRYWGISRYIHSHGMVDQEKKINVLKKVDALLFPVRWHEPYGIAIAESFAMGKPVIGSPYGSLPELIDETSGVICENQSTLFETVLNQPRKFDARVIRNRVSTLFSSEKMAKDYLSLYERVLSGEKLNQKSPQALFTTDPQSLLDF